MEQRHDAYPLQFAENTVLVSEFLTKVNYALRGIDDDAPTIGDSGEGDFWLDLLNSKQAELYEDVTKNWSVTYEVKSLGVVTAATEPVYNLDATFLAASDDAYIIKTDGTRTDLVIKKPNARTTAKREVFIAGANPEKLYFTTAILASDDIVGGTLYLPGYYMPDDYTDDTDVLVFPNPYWAVAAVAAEIAFGDITYEDKSESLNNKANMLYNLMVKKNRRGTFSNPRTSPYNVKPIRDTRVN